MSSSPPTTDKRNALTMDVSSKNLSNENPRRRKVNSSLANPIRPEMSMKQKIISQGDNFQAVWILLLPLFTQVLMDWMRSIERRGHVKFLENRIRNFDYASQRCLDPMFKERYLWLAEEILDLEHGYLEEFQERFFGPFNILFHERFFFMFPHLVERERESEVDEYHYY